jgi:hypothetical protein
MKKTALVFMIIIWPVLMFAQNNKAVTNKLKSITVYEQKFDKGTAGKTMIETVTRYDQAGNIIEEIENKQGKVDKHITCKYDSDGNKIQEIDYDPSGKKMKVTEYKYSNNLRTEKTVYNANNQVVSKKTYKYETY